MNRLLGWLRRIFGLASPLKSIDLPWKRWPESKLVEVQGHINSLPDTDNSEERAMLTVEWLINRYLPDDGTLKTEADYVVALSKFRALVRQNAEHPPTPWTPPVRPESI